MQGRERDRGTWVPHSPPHCSTHLAVWSSSLAGSHPPTPTTQRPPLRPSCPQGGDPPLALSDNPAPALAARVPPTIICNPAAGRAPILSFLAAGPQPRQAPSSDPCNLETRHLNQSPSPSHQHLLFRSQEPFPPQTPAAWSPTSPPHQHPTENSLHCLPAGAAIPVSTQGAGPWYFGGPARA